MHDDDVDQMSEAWHKSPPKQQATPHETKTQDKHAERMHALTYNVVCSAQVGLVFG